MKVYKKGGQKGGGLKKNMRRQTKPNEERTMKKTKIKDEEKASGAEYIMRVKIKVLQYKRYYGKDKGSRPIEWTRQFSLNLICNGVITLNIL